MADESIRNGNGLLITPDLVPSFPIVYHFPEVLLVIEGDAAAGAVTASVDLVALHLVDVAVLVDSASHH